MGLSRFVIMKHEAERAKLHYDLRFTIPGSKMWASFAVRKGVPLEPGIKVLAVRTEDHSEHGALLTGRIGKGYGKGKLTKWDWGYCDINSYSKSHIALSLRGNKAKGIYHLISTTHFDQSFHETYILFKSKDASEKGGNNVGKITMESLKSIVELEEVSLLIDNEEMKNIHQNIIDFFAKNPSPKDDEVHALADKLKIDPHSFESHIYMILGSILGAGKSKDFKGSYNPEEIKMGIEVEKEHTTDPVIAERIAKDHLAEIPDYYTRLKQMESAAGVKH